MTKIIDKIKSKGGYWRIILRPTVYDDKLIGSLDECIKIIEQSKVALRGWDYPHIDHSGIRIAGDNSVYSLCDWEEGPMFEYWRFYQTGQFIHYFSMREDIRLTPKKIEEVNKENRVIDIKKLLSILSTIYSLTEIFEFISRLISKINNAKSFEITIELHDVNERMLFFWDESHFLFQPYICDYDPIIIKKILANEEIISKSSEISLDIAIDIFKKFNWKDANKEIFIEDQKKLLERRL